QAEDLDPSLTGPWALWQNRLTGIMAEPETGTIFQTHITERNSIPKMGLVSEVAKPEGIMETAEEPKAKQHSSMLEEPTYDADIQPATTTFRNGGVTYRYPMAPEDFELFHSSPSWGKFFHANKPLFANGVKV